MIMRNQTKNCRKFSRAVVPRQHCARTTSRRSRFDCLRLPAYRSSLGTTLVSGNVGLGSTFQFTLPAYGRVASRYNSAAVSGLTT
jgi:hypothetical protein